MGRPSVIPELMRKLDPVLVKLTEDWLEQPEQERVATLPLVNGKVNVRKLAEMAGFRGSQEQHLFKDAELRRRVNLVAEAQGVDLVGSTGSEADDAAVTKHLRKVASERSDLAKALAEREGLIESLRRENAALREQIGLLETTGLVMRLGEVR